MGVTYKPTTAYPLTPSSHLCYPPCMSTRRKNRPQGKSKTPKIEHTSSADGRAKGKAIVLTVLREPEPIMVAADRAGVHRSTVTRWRQSDTEFDAQVKDAVLDGADVLISLLFQEARSTDPINRQAIMDALRVMGVLEGANANRRGLGEDRTPDFAIEELAQRALEQGFASTPKPLKVIDGDRIAKVT